MKKSESLTSFNLPTTSDDLVLTSTLNPEHQPSSLSKLTRRMDIIPTPNRPEKLVKSTVIQPSSIGESSLLTTVIATELHVSSADDNLLLDNQRNASATSNLVSIQPYQTDHKNEIESDDALFDSFICENFVPFSGTEPLNQWLDQTDALFHRFKISRYLRFQAIPLLIQGAAKRLYIKHRDLITSFDDFYAFLLENFDTNVPIINSTKRNSLERKVEFSKDSAHVNNLTTDFKSDLIHSADVIQQNQSYISNSSKLVTHDTTTVTGDVSDSKLIRNTSQTSDSAQDTITRDLRKAIMADFIKNPTIFRGGRDNVKKWIENTEHLMEIAHVPESIRLDLIPYALRSDALQWYRNNKSTFTSWSKFLDELKKTFLSSFSEEMAFKSLESYSQVEQQSVQQFFNEVVKLCEEADPNMSESTKLKNLLIKVKPSIQYEVRKKKPTSISQFLEFAKEAEELLQLTSCNVINNKTPTLVPPVRFDNANNFSRNISLHSSHNFNNNRNYYNDKSFRSNPMSSSVAFNSSYSPRYDRTSSNNVSRNFRPYQNKSFVSTRNTNNNYSNRPKSISQHRNKTLRSSPKSQSRFANAILSSNSLASDNNSDESYLATVCDICQEAGHEASTCQNFQ